MKTRRIQFLLITVAVCCTGAFSLKGENDLVPSGRANYPWMRFSSYSSFFLSYYPIFFLAPFQATDSLSVPQDTTGNYKPLFKRGENFRRNPLEKSIFGPKKPNPEGFESETEIDTTAGRFTSRESFDSVEIGFPYEVSLDEYLKMRRKVVEKSVWDSLLTQYDLKKALSGGNIARLIGQATGLAIPIPPNPLMGIFGKPEISINVSGEVNLRLGFRWDSQNLGTVSAFGQTQATPVFSQDIRINVSGRIGDKLKLGTDWNTNRTFDYQNTFKIGYEGYDDDIIRLVEVGNVSLPLQSSLIGGGEALFGVRADFQFGPLYLKTLFSQRRGERKFVDVKGGVSKQQFQIRAYDFAKNHFFLDTAYKQVYRDYFKTSTPILPPSAIKTRVKEIEVWESSNDVRDVQAADGAAFAYLPPKKLRQGEAYPDTMKRATILAGIVERGKFLRLDTTRYEINYNLGTLTIQNLRQDRTYAVAYRIEGATNIAEDDEYYGTLSNGVKSKDTLILKLIYRPNLQPEFRILWDRQMKNIYSINATNVNTTDTKIGIWYINNANDSTDVLQGAPDKLVTIMGVDQSNNSTGAPPPDGQFDLIPPFFTARTGEITFPSPEPFRLGLRDYFTKIGNPDLAEQYVFNEIYDTTYDVARRNTARDRFVISGEVSGRATNRISLGAFNLAPNSVKVTLDGRELREFEDYVVDYYAGTLTLRNPRAMLPNANLQIQYEQHDVFNISTRTLAGIRGDYILYKSRKLDASLGFTGMLYDQSAIIDRVRIGEEPVSNKMIGFDGKILWDAPFLTKALDALPFYDTKANSSISWRGEWAMILPEPNKRLSTVASDNNAPVVYVDDFEGAQRYISLGLTPTQWQHSSQPVDSSIAAADTSVSLYRGKIFWFQYFIPRVPINVVYPNRSTYQGRSNLSPLEINFNPDFRGIYNKNPLFLDSINPKFDKNNVWSSKSENRSKIWGGFQRLLSTFNTNFDTENIEYIEVMMLLQNFEPDKTKMYIDLGQVSEDIIPNQSLDTEDGNGANPIPNGIIDTGEDTGIDRVFDNREQDTIVYPYPLNLEKDPARDDYKFDFNKEDATRVDDDFRFYNNFEGNAVSELGQFPDSEILNKNNGQTLSLDNSYFEYEIKLDPNPLTNNQIVGGNNQAGWFLYRIPIRKPSRIVGNPLYSNIQYIRVWFKGGYIKAQIADWRLVGSQWERISNFQQNVSTNDSVLSVAFVNREENDKAPDFYTLPPGVTPPRQLNTTDVTQDIYLNEQSLSIGVRNLRYGEERMAVRIFRPMDIFYYSTLKFFIHGDGSMPDNIIAGSVPKGYAFLRFGTDSANYYEYRRPLLRGWQDLQISLSQLTAIKQRRDTSLVTEIQTFPVPGDAQAKFIIKGNPILTKVQFFGLGISNPAERFPNELTTTMWVDELRLISPESRNDWGAVSNLDIKLADLATVNASINTAKPNFHRLEERFGNRISSTNWTFSVQGNLEKFAPKSFSQMKVPITYTHAEFMQNPEFVANNDINLLQAAEAAKADVLKVKPNAVQEANDAANAVINRSQTLKVQDGWALTGVQLGLPINHFLVKETLNRITFGYNYSQEYERSPVVAERFMWIWRFTTQYSVSLPKLLEFTPMKWAKETAVLETYQDWKINLLPANLSTGLNMQRSRTTEQSRFLSVPSPVLRDFSALRTAQFSWKLSENGFLSPTIDYNVTSNSTLVNLEFDQFGQQRTGSQIVSSMFFNNGAFVDFGRSNLHNQNITINFKPKIPNFANINSYLDMSGAFITNYAWTDPLQPDPAIRDQAKQASYNNNIRFNTSLRLKSLADTWFGTIDQKKYPMRVPQDTTPSNFFKTVGRIFKTIFLDYEKVDLSITQSNNSINPGVYGGTGMNNFWGRGFLGRASQDIFGPSFAYQLGLITDPHGGFNVTSSKRFPFFGFETSPGLRPPNAILQDKYTQQTSLQLQTSRPLWEGATLELSWKTDVGFNKAQTVQTDNNGVPSFTNIVAQQVFSRTYLAFPTIFGINVFGNSIQDVVNLYNSRKAPIENSNLDPVVKNTALQNTLAESFHDALQFFTIFKGDAGKFLPAVNWAFRWEGIEKWGLWDGIAKRITLEHVYQSQYQETAQITDNGRTVQMQQIQFGFQPLFGVTAGFDEKKLKGNLTTTLRYNTTTSYGLQSSNRSSIQRQTTEELQLQASYTMRSFEFPLLGISLKNDFELSFLTSFKSNKRATYDLMDSTTYSGANKNGLNLDGNTQLTIEPRARYTINNMVTASFFYRYEGTFTEGAAQPGFSTHQIGLDIRLNISGGR